MDGPHVHASVGSEPGVADLVWSGWLPMYSLLGRSPDDRARVHGVNVANRRLSVEAYGRFLARWTAAAERCRTEDEVIALGRPRIPEGPGEPGALEGERRDLDGVDADCKHLLREALGDVGRIRDRLARRRAPLDVTLEAKAGLAVEHGAGSCGASFAIDGGAEVGCRAGTGAAAGLEADGAPRTILDAGPASVTFAGDRLESVELSREPAYARLGRSSAAVGLGGKRALGSLPGGARLSVEARVGVDVQLLDAETVRRALSREDFWARKR